MKRIVRLAREQGITLDPLLLVDYPIGTWFWAIHHEIIAEQLDEPLANRIECILAQKDVSERKIRLAALRPVKDQGAAAAAGKACNKAIAAAWKARDEAIAAAWKVCNKAIVGKAYDEVVATAWKAYDEAIAAARQAYKEAIAAAQKTCTAQWAAEYPDHPAWGKRLASPRGPIFPHQCSNLLLRLNNQPS